MRSGHAFGPKKKLAHWLLIVLSKWGKWRNALEKKNNALFISHQIPIIGVAGKPVLVFFYQKIYLQPIKPINDHKTQKKKTIQV